MQTANSWERVWSEPNKFLYNAANEFNTETGYYETHFRNYDPTIARFNGIDPLASSFAAVNPYQYGFNDPIGMNDPTGAAPQGANFAMLAAEAQMIGDGVSSRGEWVGMGPVNGYNHGRIGASTGYHWTNQFGAKSNAILMSESAFKRMYGVDQMSDQQKFAFGNSIGDSYNREYHGGIATFELGIWRSQAGKLVSQYEDENGNIINEYEGEFVGLNELLNDLYAAGEAAEGKSEVDESNVAPIPLPHPITLPIVGPGIAKLVEVLEQAIDNIEDALAHGVQYTLRVMIARPMPVYQWGKKNPVKNTQMYPGEIWKIGETTQWDPVNRIQYRYQDSWLKENNLLFVGEFEGNVFQIKRMELLQLFQYVHANGTLPPGNKMLR